MTLTCDAKGVGDVTWRFDDEEIDDDEDYKLHGLNLSISNIQSPMLGKYSCQRGDGEPSSTHLLLEVEGEDKLGEILISVLIYSVVHIFISDNS